jgi:hypothetical protein
MYGSEGANEVTLIPNGTRGLNGDVLGVIAKWLDIIDPQTYQLIYYGIDGYIDWYNKGLENGGDRSHHDKILVSYRPLELFYDYRGERPFPVIKEIMISKQRAQQKRNEIEDYVIGKLCEIAKKLLKKEATYISVPSYLRDVECVKRPKPREHKYKRAKKY